MFELGTFDNFNTVVQGVKGSLASGAALIVEALTTRSLDEPLTSYGLLAEATAYPDDFSYAIYRLRASARWHDGKPVTPEDAVFSFNALKKNSPMYSAYYQHIVKCEKFGDREVKFTFDSPGNRELPSVAGELPVLPRHWWEGADAQGKIRDVSATTLEIPLGSGPYRIKEFVAGRSVVLERVPDYWGKDLPVNVGQNNFEQVRYEFFRDDTVGREAFKADQLDWFAERSGKQWSTAYDFPAVTEKRVIKEKFPDLSSGRMQGFALNLRRPLFADVRLRQAFNYAYDWETSDRLLSNGEYHRDSSYFDGIPDFMATGLPEGQELQILDTVRDKVPAELFTTPYKNPVGGSEEASRSNLREAARLLKAAGFENRDRKLVDPKGQPVSVEFLTTDEGDERGILFYKPYLERLGMTVNVRRVDSVQYQNRLRNFDFDIVTAAWGQSLSPGNEQRDFFGSAAADRQGSRNLPGIKNPAVDASSTASSLPKIATSWLRAARRWTGYCCGTVTSSRNSPSDLTAPRAGIASAIPSRYPNMASPRSRPSGGGMRRRRPRRANALEPRVASARNFAPPCARPRRRCAERAMAQTRARRCEQRQPRHLGIRRFEISAGFPSF